MKAFVLFLIAYVGVVIATPFVFIVNLLKFRSVDYIWQCAVGFDQAGGSVLYNEEDFTISSYTYYMCKNYNKHCLFMKFINAIFGKGHCKRSFIHEMEKIQKEAKYEHRKDKQYS